MSHADVCVHALLRDGARWGACVWAAAWSAFALLTAAWEGPSALPYAAGFVTTAGAVVAVLWRAPRAGGVAALVLSLTAAFVFDHPFTRWFLAAPLAALGFASLLSAARLEPDVDPRCPRGPPRR